MRAVLTMAAFAVSAAVTGLPVAVAEPMTVSPPEVAPGDPGVTLVDDPGILKPHPIHVTAWSRSANPNAVAVHFMSGAPECYGVHATAKETGQAVTLNVDGGTRSTAVTKMCAMFAQASTVDVPLQAPLGDRRVLATY